MTRPVNHCPSKCTEALRRTRRPVVMDTETTGLRRHCVVVSVGLLIDDQLHVLFFRSAAADVRNAPPGDMPHIFEPLQRQDLAVVFHNAVYDAAKLQQDGVVINARIYDTYKLLLLTDPDRHGRTDRRVPHVAMNYRLKDACRQMLGLRMAGFPGSMEAAPYRTHTVYLCSDLLGTQALFNHLWPGPTDRQRRYYDELIAPVTPILATMNNLGVAADREFMVAERARLRELMTRLSRAHRAAHGRTFPMREAELRTWLYDEGGLDLPVGPLDRVYGRWMPSLKSIKLRRAFERAESPHAKSSLALLLDYRQAAEARKAIGVLLKNRNQRTGRIYANFNDRLATGRIAAAKPNVQALATEKKLLSAEFHEEFRGEVVRVRDALTVPEGCEFVAADLAQADVRMLTNDVDNFRLSGDQHVRNLNSRRRDLLGSEIRPYLERLDDFRNPAHRQGARAFPTFDPDGPNRMAEMFQTPGDFYTKALQAILGRTPADKKERNRYKPVILSVIYGKGAKSLAEELNCTVAEAKGHLAAFAAVFPKVAAYHELMRWQIAKTGEVETFMGRTRRSTAHHWLVTEAKVEILVSFKRGEAFWLEVVPLYPSLRTLTTFVVRAWNAKTGKLIYDRRGRLSKKPYRIFRDSDLLFRLPFRNWSWRSIRRVRLAHEEAEYEGLDATVRSLFNTIPQGATADVVKLQMLRSQPLCERFGARLVLQVHDELVFEIPRNRCEAFIRELKPVLELKPTPTFSVPIVVEIKRGAVFGQLQEVHLD